MHDTRVNEVTWEVHPGTTLLNHGAFGHLSSSMRAWASSFRDTIDSNPTKFYSRDLEGLLVSSKLVLANFLNCNDKDLVFVDNVTTGINAVLNSMCFKDGDVIAYTSFAHRSVVRLLEVFSERYNLELQLVDFSSDSFDPDHYLESILRVARCNVRLIVLEHVAGESGLVIPVEDLISGIDNNVDILVDGAHSPGMLPLNFSQLKPCIYVGNCHKWLGSLRGAGFIWRHPEVKLTLVPTVISHTFSTSFADSFKWQGTKEYLPFLSIEKAIDDVEAIGSKIISDYCRQLVESGMNIILSSTKSRSHFPVSMAGNMFSIEFPNVQVHHPSQLVSIIKKFSEEYGVEAGFFTSNQTLNVRFSCYMYNSISDFYRFVDVFNKVFH